MRANIGDTIEIVKDNADGARVREGDQFTVVSHPSLGLVGVGGDRDYWFNASSYRVLTPDWIGPPLTPEEDGVRGTIREPGLLPAFERAVAERGKTNPEWFDGVVAALFEEARESLLSKHHDYGPLNIARSPGGPLNGLRVRLWDKTARLNHLIDTGATPENESLEDTFRDMLGYSAIGLLVLRGDWPDE